MHFSGTELGKAFRFRFSISETMESGLSGVSPGPSISVPPGPGSEAEHLLYSDRNFFTVDTASSIFVPVTSIFCTRWRAFSVYCLQPWNEGLSLGSLLQQSCINCVSPSKPGVSGLGWGSSVSEGWFCLLYTAFCISDIWVSISASFPASTSHNRIPKL